MKTFEEIQQNYTKLNNTVTTNQLASLTGLSTYSIRKLTHQGILTKLDTSSPNKFLFDKQKSVEAIYVRDVAYKKYIDHFLELFNRAYNTDSIETIFALLEVDGMHQGHWNPTEEILRFFDDFNQMLIDAHKNKKFPLRKYRLALMMYCHVLEMDFAQKLLMNLLRIINKEKYVINPFSHSSIKPPSLKWKLNELFKLSRELKDNILQKYINEFYIDEIRNSFYHSDYCITQKDFRYRTKLKFKEPESSKTQLEISQLNDISITNLSVLITKCFAFFEALFHTHKHFKMRLASIEKFHKLPQYEVLELLSKDKELYGFNIHFSNDTKATFIREPESVTATNIIFETDGTVNFMVGNLDKLTKEWKVNGTKFLEKV